METNSKGSEFHSGDLDPANTVQKEGWSDGRDSAKEENSQSSPPGSLPATMSLRKTLQDSVGARPEGSSQRSSGPRGSPSPDPVPGSRLQQPRRTMPLVGAGLPGRAD